MTSPTHSKGGFTLVEVALAILVLAVALLVVIGLFPSGLSANKTSMDETYASFFADEVFNGVKALAKTHPWDQFATMRIPPPVDDIWQDPGSLEVRFNEIRANVYKYSGSNIEAFALRYRLTFSDPAHDIKRIRLEVAHGEFGPDDLADAIVFITEVFYPGVPNAP